MDPNTKLAADLAAANLQITELNARLAAATNTQVIQAKDAEITLLKGQITALETKVKEQQKVNAKAVVAAAVTAGKLAPQATELHAKWEQTLADDPTKVELLNAMPAIDAKLGTVIANGNGGAAAGAATQGNTAEDFATAVKAKCADGKVTKGQAIDLVIAEKPQAYEAWRAANGKPGL